MGHVSYKQNISKLKNYFLYIIQGGTWLAQLVGHVTLALRVMSLSPVLGLELS